MFREPEASKDYEHWLALASTWGEVNFKEMVSSAVTVKYRDSNLAYPAGMEWIKAAIDVYGPDCPAKLLKAIGRDNAPRELNGLALWRDACLNAGYDLERIRSRFRVRLKNLRESHQEICERLPEVTDGSAKRIKGQIVITPELPDGWKEKAPKGAKLICRIRPDDSGDPGKWRYSDLKDNQTFRVSGIDFLKPKIGFQVGWSFKEWSAPLPIFGQWIQQTIEE